MRHVAVGRGTQNYTCDTADAGAKPSPAGALAVLFNASCVAALHPDVLERIPAMAVRFNLSSAAAPLGGPSPLPPSGLHYFRDASTPLFDLDAPGPALGRAPCRKNATAPAPAPAPTGQAGEAAVPWLRLTTTEGATGDMREVFRVTTAGGSAPPTCRGMPPAFEVQYAAV